MYIPRKILEAKLIQLLADDIGQGDVTSGAVIPACLNVEAEIIARDSGVVAGIEEATILSEILGLKVTTKVIDGNKIVKNQILMIVVGDAQLILSVERTILNLLSRMSGIATTTNCLVTKLFKAKLKTRLAATRKTVPGLNYFDKKAVLIGGGDPHRMNLADMVLVKDNHITLIGTVQEAVKKAKSKVSFSKKIEVEVTNISDVLVAAKSGADIIMLDNFSPKKVNEAINLIKKEGYFGKILFEASGGITIKNFLTYASTQVDIISLGALTHSVKPLDITLKIIKRNLKLNL
ncbi:carboxylating nicotinate-nucleotide diphosphorylase [Candidatus Bathyarchaeota archaeon]|nr:carboxylating nicotinate-nucleotide diphosphorylase [Candidatus Bathyarchaeota archaeon]